MNFLLRVKYINILLNISFGTICRIWYNGCSSILQSGWKYERRSNNTQTKTACRHDAQTETACAGQKAAAKLALEGAGFLEEDITEIAAIRVSASGDILDIYQQLVKPITKLNRRVVAITGITEDMLADKPKLPDVLDEFFSFVGDSIVLGHDIGYNDIMNINMACRRFHRKDLFLPRFLDTERIAKRLLPTQTGGKFGLDALMKYYNLQAEGEHRALADCYSAWALYLREYESKKEEL